MKIKNKTGRTSPEVPEFGEQFQKQRKGKKRKEFIDTIMCMKISPN